MFYVRINKMEKEEILKKLADPAVAAKEVTEKFFAALDPHKTGFIAKDEYLKKSAEFAKEKKMPEGTEEQKAGFLKLIDAHTKDGKISKGGLTAILTTIFKGIAEHLKK